MNDNLKKNTGLSELERKIAARIKVGRIENGFTQKEVAAYLNVSTAAYTNYENAKRSFPHDILLKLTTILGLTINYMYTGKVSDNPYIFPKDSVDFDNEHNRWIAIQTFFESLGHSIDTAVFHKEDGYPVIIDSVEFDAFKFKKLLSMIDTLIDCSCELVENFDED